MSVNESILLHTDRPIPELADEIARVLGGRVTHHHNARTIRSAEPRPVKRTERRSPKRTRLSYLYAA
jgi:hypothetical protein